MAVLVAVGVLDVECGARSIQLFLRRRTVQKEPSRVFSQALNPLVGGSTSLLPKRNIVQRNWRNGDLERLRYLRNRRIGIPNEVFIENPDGLNLAKAEEELPVRLVADECSRRIS